VSSERCRFFVSSAGEVTNSLSFETVLKSGLVSEDTMGVNPVERIVFSGGRGTVRQIPFWRIMDGSVNAEDIKDKIIFIGATAVDLHDEKPTPFAKGTQMSGVEIQAQVANMLIENYRISALSAAYFVILLLIASLFPALIFYLLDRTFFALIVNVTIGFGWIVIIIVLFEQGTVLNFIHLNLAWIFGTVGSLLYRYFTVEKEKREIRGVFSKYVF